MKSNKNNVVVPPLQSPKLKDHLPVDYDELRGQSYADWHLARASIMESHFNLNNSNFEDLFLENSGCLSCSKNDFKDLFSKEGFSFVRCRHCDLIQVNPLPKPDLVDRFYNTEEYSKFIEEHMTQKSDYRRERFGKERISAWERYTGVSTDKAVLRSLDVGCGSGFVVEAAKENNWEAYGVDLNSKAVNMGREKGLTLFNKKLETLSQEDLGLFDVVSMYDVLEHSYNPVNMIKAAKNLLSDQGLLVIYVPNWDSLARMVLGTNTFWIWGIFHLTYFTVTTLSELVTREGFDLLHYETQGMDVADVLWWSENIEGESNEILQKNMELFQYSCNSAGLGAGLRLFAQNCG